MYFNHYTNRPVELAVRLVNTEQADADALDEPSGLTGLLEPFQDLWDQVAKPPRKSEMPSIKVLRASLREVMEASDAHQAADILNSLLSTHGAVPRLSLHSGEPHLHFEPLNTSMTSWLGTVTAMGLAAVIVENGVDRFGVCDSGECRHGDLSGREGLWREPVLSITGLDASGERRESKGLRPGHSPPRD